MHLPLVDLSSPRPFKAYGLKQKPQLFPSRRAGNGARDIRRWSTSWRLTHWAQCCYGFGLLHWSGDKKKRRALSVMKMWLALNLAWENFCAQLFLFNLRWAALRHSNQNNCIINECNISGTKLVVIGIQRICSINFFEDIYSKVSKTRFI